MPLLPPPASGSSFGARRTVARIALVAGILLVCLIAFNPHTRHLPTTGWDKLNHLLAFTSLGLAAWWAYPGARWSAFVALLGFGVLIELVQTQIPGHSAEAADLLADLLGLGTAALVARLTSHASALARPGRP
ncbi:MAG: VanZ family protein [Ideonella sp.]|nr:VanZ family protein [Ideonella sp.]